MTPRLFVRDDAAADIEAAAEWYEERRAGLGGEFLRAVRATLAAVERWPEQFGVAREPIRRALLRRFPYAVFYVREAEHIVVIACLHARRDPHVWQSRG
ncbi:MAG TPA: type II toxin-antitoxin system RelE/ParE family toxin [Gemmatimonadaceae bacterium]|nr:type II toxin-antitoxin system RelE/ParE family toxin [Gemmatimonadaceae bacterium]